ncbi:MAG: response regulator [Ilumatobacteraceae bacterium]|jgi:signal transduction histidine kinase|nr:response regulator [Ilumatobacteraceae bacterium]
MTNQDQTPSPLCILHLEDSEQDHLLIQRELSRSGEPVEVKRVETLDCFANALAQAHFNLVLADYRLAGFTALDAWQLMQERKIQLPFILLSGAIGETAAVQAIKAGISDYLPKSDLGKLRHVIQRAIEIHKILRAKERADFELVQSEKRLASFAQHLQATIEQERASIAREIHDDIGGSLAAIRFDLSWIERHTADQATLSHIAAATEMLAHAVEASQRIMMNLRPAILDQGLVAAIYWLAGDFIKRTRIETIIRAPEQIGNLPKPVQLVAYRTAQEALTNIAKHAQCTLVKIDLSGDEDVLTMEISDNGLGASNFDLSKPQSFGIRGLKERAKTVGGWIDVSSRTGAGMAITLSVPLTDAEKIQQEQQRHDPSNFV